MLEKPATGRLWECWKNLPPAGCGDADFSWEQLLDFEANKASANNGAPKYAKAPVFMRKNVCACGVRRVDAA
jgi:hypothetical protein